MNQYRRLKILLTLALLACLVPQAFGAYKCWTNNDGVRECGNAVPPEYAQKGHVEKSDSGLTVQQQARAKTLEELETELEKKRAATRAAELARKQAAEDRVLLDTFASEDDIILARDGQIANLDSQIKATESRIEKLETGLDRALERAANFERRGKEVPIRVIGEIDNLREQVVGYREFIKTRIAEQEKIRAKYALDVERYRKLTATP